MHILIPPLPCMLMNEQENVRAHRWTVSLFPVYISCDEIMSAYLKIVSISSILFCVQMEYSKALPLYERALSIYEEFYGRDHELALDTIANLAKLKQELVSMYNSASTCMICLDI